MTRKRLLTIPAALLIAAGLFYFYGGHTAPAGQPALADITPQSLSTLESAFNQSKGDVRLLCCCHLLDQYVCRGPLQSKNC